MSALDALTAGATGGIWRLAALALAALLLAGGGAMGVELWLADRDLRQARADCAAERRRADDLGAAVREQNRAVEVMAAAKEQADARGQAARQLAAANGRRYTGALAKIASARAATCAEAMPAVNALLEAVR